jgi:phage FluMu gp28-like protein
VGGGGEGEARIQVSIRSLESADKVRIISTHDGVENAFNGLIQEVRAGKRGNASVHRITFRSAVEQGLYDAAEELDVVPSQSAGAYLSLALIEQRMVPVTTETGPWVVRGKWDDAFAYLPEDVRKHAIRGWCEERLAPLLERRRPRLTVELANCPFTSQQQILEFVIDRLPRFRGGAMDATGNGAALAEAIAQRYGVYVAIKAEHDKRKG